MDYDAGMAPPAEPAAQRQVYRAQRDWATGRLRIATME